MGVGPFSSESTATDNRQSAGNNSNLLRGKGHVVEAGALDFAGSKINTGISGKSKINTGLDWGKSKIKGNVTLVTNQGNDELTNRFLNTLDTFSSKGSPAGGQTPISVSVEAPTSSPSSAGLAGFVDSTVARALGMAGQNAGSSATEAGFLQKYGIAVVGVALLAGAAVLLLNRK